MLACKPGDRSHTQELTKLQLAVKMFKGNFTTEQYNTLIHTANAWPRVVAGVGGTQDVLALVEAAALRGNPEADRAAQARISEARAAEKRDTHIKLLTGFATYDWTRDRTRDIWLAEPRAAAAGVIDQMTREVATQRTVAALGRAALDSQVWRREIEIEAEQESGRRRALPLMTSLSRERALLTSLSRERAAPAEAAAAAAARMHSFVDVLGVL